MENMKGFCFFSFVCLDFLKFCLFPGWKLSRVTPGCGGEEEPEFFPSVGQSDGKGGSSCPEITAGWLCPAHRGKR